MSFCKKGSNLFSRFIWLCVAHSAVRPPAPARLLASRFPRRHIFRGNATRITIDSNDLQFLTLSHTRLQKNPHTHEINARAETPRCQNLCDASRSPGRGLGSSVPSSVTTRLNRAPRLAPRKGKKALGTARVNGLF